jgi:hypothetical protein
MDLQQNGRIPERSCDRLLLLMFFGRFRACEFVDNANLASHRITVYRDRG